MFLTQTDKLDKRTLYLLRLAQADQKSFEEAWRDM